MALITLCPPAIAQGANTDPITRSRVEQERRAYYQMWGPEGIRLPSHWLDELDRHHNSR